ncbi:hypothetical protein NQ176_g4941 [Zarea fungicola]|uniref:Uncharacterized protein n=1 Tax=Zarea fungicola TaxID=93591 RepID=A0ACC1NBV1_9HYPO|nr:hypothetical protein NQ176_g4941 [Lecanicillium fungicola]
MATSALERIGLLASQLAGKQANGRDKLLQKNPDDIPVQVITLAIRTPLTKARKGGFKDTTLDDLLIALLKNVREKSKLDPNLVEDVCVGNVLAPGPAYVARSAVLAAGFPVTTVASVTNRFCSSGLLAVQHIANQIIAGAIDIGLESMSTNPDPGAPLLSAEYQGQMKTWSVRRDVSPPAGFPDLWSETHTSPTEFEKFMADRAKIERLRFWFESRIGTPEGLDPIDDDI